ncbi:MAG: inositol polyphosphate 5-phosphatase [Piccolia ochrophora]|nr:MAG: inositol polyphosphate 5-phosphatase [Piccolia ochrophora]
MSMRILLRDHPQRAIALVTASHSLIFRHSPATGGGPPSASSAGSVQTTSAHGVAAGVPRCIVEFSSVDALDLGDFRSLSTLPIQGTLGLITVNNDVFLCVVTGATRVATVRPGENVERIHAVEFHCLTTSEYDDTLNEDINPYPTDTLSQDGYELGQSHGRREPAFEHPCLALKKLLSGGSFYYSVDFDLTNRLQDRSTGNATFDFDSLDEGLLWNSYMIKPLVEFRSRLGVYEREALDSSRILTSAIRGFVHSITVPTSSISGRSSSSGLPSTLTLISRLSCRRAGTRFNARGIDDDGNVANFVETETVLWSPPGLCFSYAQVRGSVPLFWEQATGLLPGHQKIQITRSPEATQLAFDKHFEGLELAYGAIHIVNLLSESKPGEVELTNAFRYHASKSPLHSAPEKGGSTDNQLLGETDFDFHAETRGPGGYEAASMIRRWIEGSADGFAYYLADQVPDDSQRSQSEKHGTGHKTTVILQQEGVFRTNCLDCLDRTNLVQTIISQMAIEAFLGHRKERAGSDFWMRHSTVWADNGDSLSKIYAGTGALKSSFTRHGKMSLAGALSDARKSATRMYINNFADKGRQNTMDLLLGRLMGQTPVHLFDPINDFVSSELNRRAAEYSSAKTINIWAGTLNLNGRTTGIESDLTPWLCPEVVSSQQNPEIVAVGFQEIVELSPQHIMSTDPSIRQLWESAAKTTLNEAAKRNGSEEYVLLRSGQLVGAALAIFVKSSVLNEIKNVEGSVKKTGMSGMAGNKGAVAIRMDYANTRLCFVTAHLAAGFANYEERNRDYRTISHGLRFQRNRSIEDHDSIIWLGDFNYRIGLGDDKVRKLIHMGDLDKLYSNDQLNLQMVAGLAFPFYSEARITFMPTYKYNVGSDDYDTSEKARIPAWCDRVLRKGSNLRQVNYNTAPLRFSDHRPVYSTFQCTISNVDEALKNQLSLEIYNRRRHELGGNAANRGMDESDDEDLIGYDPIAPGLPPASSDRRKWWLDNGAPARSNIQPPSSNSVPNPQRPPNPFTPTTKPDWVNQPRAPLSRQQSSQSAKSSASAPAPNVSTGPTRRLPPPLLPSSGSTLSLPSRGTLEQVSTKSPSKQSPKPTHQPADPSSPQTSSSIESIKKPAPPVPKKPAVLLSPTSQRSSFSTDVVKSPSSLPGSAGLPPSASHAPVPPPPRRTEGAQAAKRTTAPRDGQRAVDGPVLPPRTGSGDSGPADALMDDDGRGEMSGVGHWKPLRPR